MALPGIAKTRAGISGLLLGAALSVLGASLGGCQPPEYGPEETGGKGGDTTKAGTSTLTLMNQRQTDPGPLTFLLYKPTTQDIENVPPAVTLKSVEFEKTIVVSVTPGRWKVAYRHANGDLQPMPPYEEEATYVDWPVVAFEKGKSYTILIETDDGGITIWRSDLPVVK